MRPSPERESELREAFRAYLGMGWHPVPYQVVANADNSHRSKIPMLREVAPFFDTAPTEADFDLWMCHRSADQTGLAFALPGSVVVVDLDGRDGPLAAIPPTETVPWLADIMGSVSMWTKSPGGFHFFFKAPANTLLKNGTDLGPKGLPFKLDVRTGRGFIVVGPTHVFGMDGSYVCAYETANAIGPEGLPTLPDSVASLISAGVPKGVPAAKAIDDGSVPVGKRHSVALSLALVIVNAVVYEADLARAKDDFTKAVSELFEGDIDWKDMESCFESAVAKKRTETNGAWPEQNRGRLATMRDRVKSLTASQLAADRMGIRITGVERMDDIIKFTVSDGKSFGVPLGDLVNQAAFRKAAASAIGYFPKELPKREYEAFLSGQTFASVESGATAVANAIRETIAAQYSSVMDAEDEESALSLAADGQWQKVGNSIYFSRYALENASRFIEKHSPSVVSFTLMEMGAESRRIKGKRGETRVVWRLGM